MRLNKLVVAVIVIPPGDAAFGAAFQFAVQIIAELLAYQRAGVKGNAQGAYLAFGIKAAAVYPGDTGEGVIFPLGIALALGAQNFPVQGIPLKGANDLLRHIRPCHEADLVYMPAGTGGELRCGQIELPHLISTVLKPFWRFRYLFVLQWPNAFAHWYSLVQRLFHTSAQP